MKPEDTKEETMNSSEDRDPSLLLDPYELEQQTSPHLRAISMELLELTEVTCELDTNEPPIRSSQQGNSHGVKAESSNKHIKKKEKREKKEKNEKKKSKRKSSKVDLLSEGNSSTNDAATNKTCPNSPQKGRSSSSSSESLQLSQDVGNSVNSVHSRSVSSNQGKQLRSVGSGGTTSLPGAMAIQGIQRSRDADDDNVPTASNVDIDLPEPSLSLGSRVSGGAGDSSLGLTSASLERTITATAVTREELEQEVRQRILQEAVLAEAQPISEVVNRSPQRRVSFATIPESARPNLPNSDEKQFCRQFWFSWRWWIIGLAGVLIVMGILGFVLSTQLPTSQKEETTPYPPADSAGANQEPFDDTGKQSNLRGPTSSPTIQSTPPTRLWNSASLKEFLVQNTFDGGAGFQVGSGTATVAAYDYIVASKLWDEFPLDERMMDVFVLLGLYFSTNGASSWINKSGWGTNASVCAWYGVQCNGNDLAVELSLPSNGVSGRWPPEMNNLGSRLEYLDLSVNKVTFGYVAVSSLKSMGQLKMLNLSSSGLAGTFENLLGYQLSLLQTLDLSLNSLTGSILGDISNLSQLRQLLLQNNQFTGTIPSQLLGFQYMQVARFEGNGFTGNFPPGVCDRNPSGAVSTFSVDCTDVNCTCCTCF